MLVIGIIIKIIVLGCIIIQTTTLAQVCVETKMDYQDVPETFLYTYMEAYEKSNCLFWCTATRVATAMGTRTVRVHTAINKIKENALTNKNTKPIHIISECEASTFSSIRANMPTNWNLRQKLKPQQINVCCDGYIQDENNNGTSIHCKPDCSPSCVNGYCKSPGVCACNPGYLPDLFDIHICSPLCIKGCDHGTCTAPNTCLCDSGYDLVNGVCQPICSEPCLNGSCVAPDTCRCLPGYKKSVNDTCEPFCSSYTASGECINSIICESGWIKVIKNAVETCEPVCSQPCVHGTCIAPDTCECLNGYEKSINDICEPYCSFGCENGICISPQTCVCNPGWYKKESSGTCLPHCDIKCGNGTCAAPNVCECYPGYELNKSQIQKEKDADLCVPICDKCEGSCIAPDICIYEPHNDKDEGDNVTEATVMMGSTDADFFFDNDSTLTSDLNHFETNHNDHNELKIEKASSWYNSNWCYAVGSILILTVIILMTAMILKRKQFKSLGKNIFSGHISENDVSTTAVHYKQST